jgi:peptidoglycan LD-endopeptidase LytH
MGQGLLGREHKRGHLLSFVLLFLLGFVAGAISLATYLLSSGQLPNGLQLGAVATINQPVKPKPIPPAKPVSPLKPKPVPPAKPVSPSVTPTPPASTEVTDADYKYLLQRHLKLPVVGVNPKTVQDTFHDSRPGGRRHEATDILAAIGTPIVAVDDGVIQKLFTSKDGGLTIYEFDPTKTYCYYYAHLERYADGLKEGMSVKKGEVIGFVGTTGDAGSTPQLHFAVFKLGPEKKWWKGTPIDPYPLLVQ